MATYLKSLLKYTILMGVYFIFHSCGKTEANSVETSSDSTRIASTEVLVNASNADSIAVMQAFSKLKTNPSFLKDLGLKGEKHFTWNDDLMKVISGDLNSDGVQDALLFFSVEGIGGGNNWSAHYAAFLKSDNDWKYKDQLDAGGDFNDRILELTKIENDSIYGNWVGNKDESLEDIPVQYILKNDKFINIFTALHIEENPEKNPTESVEDWTYLQVTEILTADNMVIPLSSTLTEYEKLLGKNYVIKVDKTAECGTVYEDMDDLTEVVYKNLTLELGSKKQATITLINMKGSGLRFQTENGTIDENTTIAELQKLFPNNFSSNNEPDENNEQVFQLGAVYENSWVFSFDRSGKLKRIGYHVPC